MPELPDLTIYLEALRTRLLGQRLERVRLISPFVLRTFAPPLAVVEGKSVRAIGRLGKRIVLTLDGDLFLVIHLMIAGRLQWRPQGATVGRKHGLAAFDFASGTLILTEAGSKKRAALHVVDGSAALQAHDPGGIEPLECDLAEFGAALRRENHTLKRALTDPHLIAGIGNAYSDEILHRARLSPFLQTAKIDDAVIGRLLAATREVLTEWTDRLRAEAGAKFPERVTAFRSEMAVHGRYGQPCPDCGAPVQRILYAENEANYCAVCQTGGRLLADRALSRLLKSDWPRSLEELEARRVALRVETGP